MNYELYMGAALAEASSAAAAGERADGAVAVLDDAMVASACDRVRGSGDPTAHAVIGTLREAAERLGTTSLSGADGLRRARALRHVRRRAARERRRRRRLRACPTRSPALRARRSSSPAARTAMPHRLNVVSGILEADAAELLARADRPTSPRQPDPAAHA